MLSLSFNYVIIRVVDVGFILIVKISVDSLTKRFVSLVTVVHVSVR